MRKVTMDAVNAFLSDTPFARSNTVVKVEGKETRLYLFRNLIARKDAYGNLWVNRQGWRTLTTHERLNGVLEKWLGNRPFSSGDDLPTQGWIDFGPRVDEATQAKARAEGYIDEDTGQIDWQVYWWDAASNLAQLIRWHPDCLYSNVDADRVGQQLKASGYDKKEVVRYYTEVE